MKGNAKQGGNAGAPASRGAWFLGVSFARRTGHLSASHRAFAIACFVPCSVTLARALHAAFLRGESDAAAQRAWTVLRGDPRDGPVLRNAMTVLWAMSKEEARYVSVFTDIAW